MVTAGLLGRKSGRGFYSYPRSSPPEPEPEPEAAAVRVAVLDSPTLIEVFDKVLSTEDADVVLVEAPTGGGSVIAAAMASGVGHPSTVVGIHLVGDRVAEVVHTVHTAPSALAAAGEACVQVGRTPVVCADRAGYVVNALLYPYLNDAVRMLEASYATVDDIDHAMTLGCGYPAGPFAMLDAIGLDAALEVEGELYRAFREPGLAPAPLLQHMVTAGRTFRSRE
jgi:3-hydroxybutyryl-CoA dehydrogenase